MRVEAVGFGWNLLIVHRFVFFPSMTTKLLIKQDMEDKARGVLLHLSMYMGNDKFKTLKLPDFSLPEMTIMYLKDAGNTCGFSAAVSEPPFQQNTHCFAVGGAC